MARMIRVVESSVSTSTVSVPDEVAAELEELFAHLSEHPSQVALGEFDSAEEKDTFIRQAKSWAGSRPDGTVVFRQLKSTSLPDTQVRFKITPPLSDEAKAEAERKRDEAKARREAAAAAGEPVKRGPGRPRKVAG